MALATLSDHMHKKCEVNRTNIKIEFQSETKVAELISKSELPVAEAKWPSSSRQGKTREKR